MNLVRALEHRKIGANVRRRILSFYPDGFSPDGIKLRGWHPSHSCKKIEIFHNLVGKRKFIQKFGPNAWRVLPNFLKHKFGRHKYVARVTVEDNLHLMYLDKSRQRVIITSNGRKYANDPKLELYFTEAMVNG